MMGLTHSYFEYLSLELNKAMKGFGTKEKIINEIILSRNNSELQLLQETYATSECRGGGGHGCQGLGEEQCFVSLLECCVVPCTC